MDLTIPKNPEDIIVIMPPLQGFDFGLAFFLLSCHPFRVRCFGRYIMRLSAALIPKVAVELKLHRSDILVEMMRIGYKGAP